MADLIPHYCQNCQDAPIENKDTGLCASCSKEARDNEDDMLYNEARKIFLQYCIRNNICCPRCRQPVDMSFDIHHKAGRGDGYVDKWAETMGIKRLYDIRFFLAVDRECHQWIETHPEVAKKRGWSLSRLSPFNGPLNREDMIDIYYEVKQLPKP